MTYLVMETHMAYAVLLDENGRFLKAANLRYQVGDTVENIVELRQPAPRHTVWKKSLTGLAGLAACLCLAFFGWWWAPSSPSTPTPPACPAMPSSPPPLTWTAWCRSSSSRNSTSWSRARLLPAGQAPAAPKEVSP